MPMNRAKKAIELQEVENYIAADIQAIVVVENKGMTVKMVEALRREAGTAGARYKVSKNSLSKIALGKSQFAGIVDMFKGPTALILSKDPIAAAKVAQKFAKEYADKFVILGGAMGADTLDAKKVVQLANLPSLDELRGKLVGLLQAPAQKIAAVVQAPAAQLARVVNAYAQKAA
jgi:large subunit ribosomal protein L10